MFHVVVYTFHDVVYTFHDVVCTFHDVERKSILTENGLLVN